MDRRTRASGVGAPSGGKAGSELTVFKPPSASAPPPSGPERNPFTVPTDQEIFQFRLGDDAEGHADEAKDSTKLRIWDKTTAASRVGRARKIDESEIPEAKSAIVARLAAKTRGLPSSSTSQDLRRETRPREVMSTFLAQKREMFLVQMALDTKREEVQKLEQKAHAREEALKRSELLLEEDAIRFDAFLKENDKMAHEALKAAERETKQKADKMQEIKRLKHAISIVEGEKAKLLETLEDAEQHRQFLESLTPAEWTQTQQAKHRQRQEDIRNSRFAAKLAAWEADVTRLQEEAARKEDEERRAALKEGKMYKKPESAPELPLRPRPRLEDEPAVASEFELPMYFTSPTQLLDVFTEMEESNLFLIQHGQETEQHLEELRQQLREVEKSIAKQTATLEDNVRALRQQAGREEGKLQALEPRDKFGGAGDGRETAFKVVTAAVTSVYETCGFDPSSNPGTLTMMAAIEARLEELRVMMLKLEQTDEEYVIKKEKEHDKLRREALRAERLDAQKEAYAHRLQVSLARAQAPVKKKTGKPVMFRSAPLKVVTKKEEVDLAKEQELRDLKFLT